MSTDDFYRRMADSHVPASERRDPWTLLDEERSDHAQTKADRDRLAGELEAARLERNKRGAEIAFLSDEVRRFEREVEELREAGGFGRGENMIRGVASLLSRATAAEASRAQAVEEARRLLDGCPQCHGTGEREGECRYCGDSTYDHECVTRMLPCLTCAWVRRALLPTPPKEPANG